MQNADAIPRETALGLCREIRQQNRTRWYTLNSLRCLRCIAVSRDNPDKRIFASKSDYRGCGQVNVRFDALPRPTVRPAVRPTVEPAVDAAVEQSSVIYLPPAGFSATQRKRTCAGCGRQFRIAASQKESEYCPTCDYRRLRGELIQQAGDDEE